MSLNKYTKEQIEEKPMVELAYEILLEENQAMHFTELYNLIAEAKGFNETQKQRSIVQFYTDLNVEGKIISVGQSMWGLKVWYPYEQIEDDILPFNDEEKPKKKKKKKVDADVEDELIDDEEEYDVDEEELDEETIFDEDADEDEDTEFEEEPLEFVEDEAEPFDDVNND